MAKACFMYTFCHNFVPPIRFGGYSSKNADLILASGATVGTLVAYSQPELVQQ